MYKRPPRVLAVGPYERDNVGDLLFLLVTEHYLRGADVTAAAPFGADMTALLDRRVPAYAPLLHDEDFDVVWTVGGQVGGIDARRAFRISASPRAFRAFERGSAERDPGSRLAVVQLSGAALRTLGHAEVAAALAGSRALRGLRIRLVAAGVARGHDSLADYALLMDELRRIDRGIDVAIAHERRPLAVVDRLRSARVVIGTSLHVRIIAAAYGVPRVTLTRPKASRYAETWDPDMPHDVSLGALDGAVAAALAEGARPAAHAAALARRAHEHLTGLAGEVLALAESRRQAATRA